MQRVYRPLLFFLRVPSRIFEEVIAEKRQGRGNNRDSEGRTLNPVPLLCYSSERQFLHLYSGSSSSKKDVRFRLHTISSTDTPWYYPKGNQRNKSPFLLFSDLSKLPTIHPKCIWKPGSFIQSENRKNPCGFKVRIDIHV